jgi:hypothetical protein
MASRPDDLVAFFAAGDPDKQFAVMPGIAHASFQQTNYQIRTTSFTRSSASPRPSTAEPRAPCGRLADALLLLAWPHPRQPGADGRPGCREEAAVTWCTSTPVGAQKIANRSG